jgi:Flp pilus assembly protein CpaB
MSMIVVLSLLIAIVGAIVYLAASNPKAQQLALYAWAAGLLAFLMHADKLLRLG